MKKFKKVYIEITNRCNLNCSFCSESSRKGEFMSCDSFGMILDEIKPFTDHIYLHVKGEPFLHPDLDKILDISHEKGFHVNITTNGTLLNNVRSKIAFKPAIRQINFSIHGLNEQYSEEEVITYLDHILSFTKELQLSSNIYISLRFWNLQKPNAGRDQLARNATIFNIIEKAFDLDYSIGEKLSPGRGMKIKENLYINSDYEFKWPEISDTYENKIGYCYGLRDQVAILVDGTVVPCCLDSEGIINLGNIFKAKFGDIVTSKRALDIYDGFSNRIAVEKLCMRCTYKERF